MSGASKDEKSQFFLDDMAAEDFNLLSQTGEYKRRDGVSDRENHVGMKKAMVSLDFVTFVVCEYALCFMNANLIDKPLFIFLGIYWFLGWNNSILDASCGCCFMGWKHEIQRIGA